MTTRLPALAWPIAWSSGRAFSSASSRGRSRSSTASPSSTTWSAGSSADTSRSPTSGWLARSKPCIIEARCRSETIAVSTGAMLAGRRPVTLERLPVFCRHNRLTGNCPICSKGTALEPTEGRPRRRRPRPESRRASPAGAREFRGPFAVAGPYQDDQGGYEVRLERVPGGLRLAAWQAGSIRRQAPVLAADDLAGLILAAGREGALEEDEAASLLHAMDAGSGPGRSPGRAGELREEL